MAPGGATSGLGDAEAEIATLVPSAEAEVCHWIAPDGTRHPCTYEENAEVRRELLIMRTISDKRRQQQSEER